jgi:hypothetical protein
MTTDNPTLIERAHLMLRQAEAYGDLDEDQLLQAAAMGASPMRAQEARLNYAATLALLSIAESLATMASQPGAKMAGDEADRRVYVGPLPGETVLASSDGDH